MSAADAIAPAFEHTTRQLLRPFRIGQWVRLALVGLLAGELSSGGGCNAPNIPNFNQPRHTGNGTLFPPGLTHANLALYAGLIATVIVVFLIFFVAMMYVSSVMRFVLFDSILTRECRIRDRWISRQREGWRYFLWKLAFAVVSFALFIVLIGIPAGVAFMMGWFRDPHGHMAGLIVGGILVFFAFSISSLALMVIYVLTKDFVVPQMALEGIGVIEGWRRLGTMMNSEKGGYAAYIGMKILLAMGAAIVLGIATFLVALILLIPVAGMVIAAIIAAKSAGVGWTVYTITLAVVAGCVLFAVFLFLSSLISVPAIVFFPAYSIYFFAPRYPALSGVLYPAPPVSLPQTPSAAAPPPALPPSTPPSPEPIA